MLDERRIRAAARAAGSEASQAPAGKRQPDIARRKAQSALEIVLLQTPRSSRDALACRKGCAMCCHLRVAAMPVEVLGVLDYLRQQRSPAAMEAVARKVAATAAQLRALPAETLLTVNIPCPLLGEDGACSVYPARPFNCRAYHSLDVEACKQSFAHPDDLSLGHPQSTTLAQTHAGLQEGLRDSLQGAGYDVGQYELVTALDEAISDDGCRARHEAGAVVFDNAIRL